jgi:aldehyde dehydrogenase (NAD+)
VLKPAASTPLTALRLAEILQEVELPAGVVNIVTGPGETGRMLVEHAGVAKVAFTGSSEVGKLIARAAAPTGRNLTLELGGRSTSIIFEDAAIAQAVEGIVPGSAGSRLLVQESILDEVIERLTERMSSLRLGDPLDRNTDVGAVTSRSGLEGIRDFVERGSAQGARLHEVNTAPLPERGFWCRPCFFSEVQPSHTIAREEVIGPVLVVMSFRTPEEAIERANNVSCGLAAAVWTDKGSKAMALARRLEAGVIWCNTCNRFDPAAPFGGVKESGFGRAGGVHGLRPYVELIPA